MSNNISSGPYTQFKSGTSAQWTVDNPVLGDGEPGYESDTKVFKIGDGVSAWSDLTSIGGSSSSGLLTDGPIYTLEDNSGTQTLADGASHTIVYDTLSAGVTEVSPGFYEVPSGIYVISYDIEPAQPAEDRWVYFTVSGGTAPSIDFARYPLLLSSTSPSWYGNTFSGQGLISGGFFSTGLIVSTIVGGGSPLALEYSYIKLTKIS